MCREEADGLASLIPRLAKEGRTPALIGICLEESGVEAFRGYLGPTGRMFLDQDRVIYKLQGERWLSYLDLFRPSLIMNGYAAASKGLNAWNLGGEGRLLGGLLLISPTEKNGVVYEYRETIPGDRAPLEAVFEASMKHFPINKAGNEGK